LSELVGGRYEIIRKIAEGGMGAVFEARHHMTKKTIALKVLFPHIGKDEASRQRFLREVSAPATIGHDGIVEVYDSGIDPNDGSLFVAMEMLIGETMREWVDRGGHTRDEILALFDDVLAPLAMAHERGIVHRDLKPENVFLHRQKNGQVVVKILDFGIARDLDTSSQNVTHTGIAMGTPHYMAPEQAMSAKGVQAQADVWALGAMLYECLTGRTPFDGETASAIVVFACTKPHPPIKQVVPDLPDALAQLVDRCLAKEPTERPANAGALRAALQQIRGGGATFGAMVSTPSSRDQGLPQTRAQVATNPTGGGTSAPTWGSPQQQQTPPPGQYGTPPPGQYGTPPPGQAGYATPPPGQTPQPAPLFQQGPVGGGGPMQTGGPMGGPMPTGGPMGTAPAFGGAQPQGGGKGMFYAGIALVALLVIGGGIAAAVVMSGDEEGTQGTTGTDPETPAGPGQIQVATDVSGGGELLVDGVSQGPVLAGHQMQLAAGQHILELRVAGQTVAVARVAPTPAQTTQVVLNRGSFTGGETSTQSGSLQAGDRTLTSGEFADHFTLDWTQGTRVYLQARSSEFDTYLIAKRPSGTQLDNDDATPGQGTDAGLGFTVDEAGTWTIIVTSYRAGEAGNYELVTSTLVP